MRRAALALVAALSITGPAVADDYEEHRHPPQDAPSHEKFYFDWMRPDLPTASCCNKSDCYPTEIEQRPAGLFARRREDGHYIFVPEAKIEHNRDNPDGRNHVCMAKPNPWPEQADIGTVYCFIFGGGF